jgi:hypothetical protein
MNVEHKFLIMLFCKHECFLIDKQKISTYRTQTRHKTHHQPNHNKVYRAVIYIFFKLPS